MSPVFDCTTDHGRADAIPKAAAGVREGGLVVLPTDTLYGVGADAFSPDAVGALLAAKGRGRNMPSPVLVGSPTTLPTGWSPTSPSRPGSWSTRFGPGGLTRSHQAPALAALGPGKEPRGTVAVRMPLQPGRHRAAERHPGPLAVLQRQPDGRPPAVPHLWTRPRVSWVTRSTVIYLDGGQADQTPWPPPSSTSPGRCRWCCGRARSPQADVMDVVERARADALELNAVGPEPTERADEPRDAPSTPSTPSPEADEAAEDPDDPDGRPTTP